MVPIDRWSEYKRILRQMRESEVRAKFQTIIVDTVDLAWQACEDFICKREGVDKIGDIPYGAGYSMVEKEFDESLREIVMLDYGLVMISHDEDKTFPDESGVEYQKIVPTLAKRPRKVVLRMTDINGYSKTIAVENGYKQVLYLRGTPRFEAGSRWRFMPAKIDFTYSNLVQAISEAIDKEEAEGATVVDEHINTHKTNRQEHDYEMMMTEARKLIQELITKDEVNKERVAALVNEHFGMGKKFMGATREQVDIIAMALEDLRTLAKKQNITL